MKNTLLLLGALLCGGLASAQSRAQFDIDMQAEIAAGRFHPDSDRLGLRGNLAPLRWDQSLALQPLPDRPGHYGAQLVLPSAGRSALLYKLKIDQAGQPQAGWEEGRNHRLALDGAAPAVVQRAFGVPAPAAPLSRVGQIVRHPALPSRHVGARGIQVWLPPGYADEAERRYPVLYLHDGQALFDTAELETEWEVDETATRLLRAGAIAPCIIVAIDHTPQRLTDYTPVAGPLSYRPGASTQRVGGGAAAYGRYLVDELKPFIDAHYRTQPQRSGTSIGGASLGGLVSLWLAAHYPQVYGAALVVSPSVWWSERHILGDTEVQFATLPAHARARLWLDIGLDEGEEAVRDARDLHARLQRLAWAPGQLQYTEVPHGQHDEASWAARLPQMLRFLYGR